ncbi:MAG TPA: DUF4124 domain-containing protein, partial [Candidatus Binatia bacterium]|nr:DUF4124 domain-containing protein [Candidatus Binatia bacterium]
MSRTRLKITILALALGGRVAAQEVHGWRTPSGELYFGAAPPPGSTRIDSLRTRPTRPPAVPEAPVAPRATVTPRPTPTARPTPVPAAAALPTP